MMQRTTAFWLIAMLIAGATGCASMFAADTERQLSAAGFQMKMADTAGKASHLASLKQHKVFPAQRQGRVVYVYADAKGCNCMYAGSEADYQRYERMIMVKREVDEQREEAEDLDEASMQWGMWGSWYRPIY